MKDFFELRENKIFFVKVGSGRDSMIVKTKANNSRDAVKKMKTRYPNKPASLDRNQKQGQPAGAFESVNEATSKIKTLDEVYRKPTAAEIAADKRKERRASGNKGPDSSARYKNIKKKMYGNAMGGLKKEESVELGEAAWERPFKGHDWGNKDGMLMHTGKKLRKNPKLKGGVKKLYVHHTNKLSVIAVTDDKKSVQLIKGVPDGFTGRVDVFNDIATLAYHYGLKPVRPGDKHTEFTASGVKVNESTDNYKVESTDLEEEKYAVKYTHPTDKKSGRTVGPMSKAAADKKAAMGNRVDKVGGKYTVIRHVEEDWKANSARRMKIKQNANGPHRGPSGPDTRTDAERMADRAKQAKRFAASKAKQDKAVASKKEEFEESTMSDRQVVRAMRIAKDMAGNHTGATRAIEKLKKGLSNHPKVRAALRTHNESVHSADKKPENYRDPETGKMKVRMVAVDRDISSKKVNESAEENLDEISTSLLKRARDKASKNTVDARNSATKNTKKHLKDPEGGHGIKALKDYDKADKSRRQKKHFDKALKKRFAKESVELEERVNSVKYARKDFENTKKGDKLEIKWGDSISSGRSATFVVAGKSVSKKYNVEKLRLEPEGKKGGVKFFLRSRNGGDATFSIGDMAAIMTSIKKV